jgi:hypothetical protein
MIVHEPQISLQDGEVLLSARVETDHPTANIPEVLWYAFPERYQEHLSLRADPFLSALVLVAQAMGENLHLHGETSPRLLYGVTEYQQIFHHWNPALYKRIEITASKISPAPPSRVKDQYLSPFSGGVDSFFTLHQSLFPEPGQAAWPLTHGLFMQGSTDIPLAYPDKYRILSERYTRLYGALGLELITARTNLMQFSAHHVPFESFLEAPIVSCAMALSPILSGIFIPSGETYRRYRITSTGPLTPQYLSTESFESKSSGGTTRRLDKVEVISHWEPVQKNLRVCFGFFMSKGSTANCSSCSKCMRTRMDLHILGRLDAVETLDRSFTLGDYLRWGRWLEAGYGWEKNAWNYCRKHRPSLLPLLLLGIVIGYTRVTLKRFLPKPIRQWIFKYTAVVDPHIMHEVGQPVIHTAHREERESS